MKTNIWIFAVLSIFTVGSCEAIQTRETESGAKQEQSSKIQATESSPDDADSPTQEQIDKLAKYLTGAKLTGHFTVSGQADKAPRSESYWIDKAEKNPEGDKWTITARIKYGDNDIKVPMVMDIKWAGGTPVITVDQMSIIGMGTFDARVLFRSGLYAGTWRHDEVGGHLFGTVMTAEEQTKEAGQGAEKKPDNGQSVYFPVLPCKETGVAGGN